MKLREALSGYDAREAQSIIDLLLEEVCQITRVQRILTPDLVLSDVQRQQLSACAEQLRRGVPVQQALGYEWFCGQRFKVSSDVLIPRPETAELVDWICRDAEVSSDGDSRSLQIVDIGTGSGCIALSLARLINNSQVLAIDLSTAALSIAQQNSCKQGMDNVQFAQSDILAAVDNLTEEHPLNKVFNIIVSNPPYICQQEKVDMSPVVLDHEPSLALFVPDEDPLLFYRAIARFGLAHLAPGGLLYFEINAAYGQETCQLLQALGYNDIQLRQDINGRDRMIRAKITPNS